VNGIPRESVGVIADRIEELDFGYDSENMPSDTWRAALDIATSLAVITPNQRVRIESEDRNQATLEREVERMKRQREWDALTPEEQEHRRFMRESFEAQNKTIREIYYNSVFNMAFKMPGAE
jgi:glucosamine 6-phosphate synthetase-like amidotransferase/phosphosugar isomerase protein